MQPETLETEVRQQLRGPQAGAEVEVVGYLEEGDRPVLQAASDSGKGEKEEEAPRVRRLEVPHLMADQGEARAVPLLACHPRHPRGCVGGPCQLGCVPPQLSGPWRGSVEDRCRWLRAWCSTRSRCEECWCSDDRWR